MEIPEILTATEAADLLRVNKKVLKRWAKKGIIKGTKIGPRGDWRFLRKDVEFFLNDSLLTEEDAGEDIGTIH